MVRSDCYELDFGSCYLLGGSKYWCDFLRYCTRHGSSGNLQNSHLFTMLQPEIESLPQGILDRYKQIQPKYVFFETEVVYAGKTIDLVPKIVSVAQELHSFGLQKLVLLPSTKTGKEVVNSEYMWVTMLALREEDRWPWSPFMSMCWRYWPGDNVELQSVQSTRWITSS